jgi:hypothetical protein
MSEGEPEVTEHVERTDVGVSITAKLKRGTGTRDQDTITAKVKRKELADARDEMDEVMDDLKRWSEDARDIQPEDGE